jgi:WD40-like Beta Propeller Repeat
VARRLTVGVATGPGRAYRQDFTGGPLTRIADIVSTVPFRHVDYTPDGAYLAAAVGPQYRWFRRDGDEHTDLPRPLSISTGGAGVAWHEDGRRVAYTYGSANRLYSFLRTGDILAYAGANVGGNPTSASQTRAVDYGGDYVAVGIASVPFINWYRADEAGLLTKMANPAVVGRSAAVTVAWSPDGLILAAGNYLTPRLILYARESETLVRLPDPPQPPVVAAYTPGGLAWSPDGTRLVFATEGGLRYFTHDGAGGLTLGPDPDVQPPGTLFTGCAFDREGGQLAATSNEPPYVTLYTHTGDGLLIQPPLNDPPTDVATTVAWTPDDAAGLPTPVVPLGEAVLDGGGGLTGTVGTSVSLGPAVLDGTATLEGGVGAEMPLGRVVLDGGGGLTGTVGSRAAVALTADLTGGGGLAGVIGAEMPLTADLGGGGRLAGPVGAEMPLSAALTGRGDLAGSVRGGVGAVVAELPGTVGAATVTTRTGTAHVTNRTGMAHL